MNGAKIITTIIGFKHLKGWVSLYSLAWMLVPVGLVLIISETTGLQSMEFTQNVKM